MTNGNEKQINRFHLAKLLSGVIMNDSSNNQNGIRCLAKILPSLFVMLFIILSHDVSFSADHIHVWVDQFNTVNHYKKCNICGTTTDVEAHSYPAANCYWSEGSASNCSITNHYYKICNCGYSYIDDSGRAAHTPGPVLPDSAWNYIHAAQCLVCNQRAVINERCYKSAADQANNRPIQCNNLGQCYKCGRDYTIAYHLVDPTQKGDKCTYCNRQILDFSSMSFTIRDDSATQKFVEVKFKTLNANDSITSTTPHVYDPKNYNAGGLVRVDLNHSITNKNVVLSGIYNMKSASELHVEEPIWLSVYAHFLLNDGSRSIVQIPSYYFNQYFRNDITAPTFSVTTQRYDGYDGWSKNVKVIISGTESYCGSVTLQAMDLSTNQYIPFGSSNVARISVNSNSFSYDFMPNININTTGKTIRLIVSDLLGNTRTRDLALSKVDVSAPTITTSNITYGNVINATLTDNLSFLSGYQITTTNSAPSSWTSLNHESTKQVQFANKNVGTYYIWAIDGAGNIGSATVVVSKANGSASVTMADWTYGGTASNPVPTSSTNGTSNVTYKYKGRGSTTYTETTTKPSNAGTYTVTATFATTTNYKEVTATANFTINKRPCVAPTITGWSGTYDGSAHSITTGNEGTYGTLQYKVGDNGTWTNGNPNTQSRTSAGTTKVYARRLGDANNATSSEVNASIVINKKAVTITAKAQTITYGDGIATGVGQVTVSGLLSSHSLTAITLTASRTTAGTGTITPSAPTISNSATDNYSYTFNTGVLTINKATTAIAMNPGTTSVIKDTFGYSLGEAHDKVSYGASKSMTATVSTNSTRVNCPGTLTAVSDSPTLLTVASGSASQSVSATTSGASKTVSYNGVEADKSPVLITLTFTPTDTNNFVGSTNTFKVVVVDEVAPTGSIIIKSPIVVLSSGKKATKSQLVDLELTTIDGGSYIDKIAVFNENLKGSSTSATTNNISSSWIDEISHIEDWELSPNDGWKTVYLVIRDAWGNTTAIPTN